MSNVSRVVLACALAAASACQSDPAAPDERGGRLELSLTGHAASGAVYRLRDAEIAVSPGGPVFHTEDDPDRASITAFLDPGAYALTVAPGWRLERVSGGQAETVVAALTSANPQPFEVRAGEVTPLALRFRVGGHAGQGSIDLTLEIDEDAPPQQRFHYVTSRIDVPRETNTPIKLDIDGDGKTENALGRLLAALYAQSGGVLDLQAAVDRGVDRGDIIQLDGLETDNVTHSTTARLTSYDGADPSPTPCESPSDTVCGRHLEGDGSFHIAATSPTDSAIAGSLTDKRFVGGPGVLRLRLPLGVGVLDLRLLSARADLTLVSPHDAPQGIVGGAITVAELDSQLIPYLAGLVGGIVANDCRAPTQADCGCPSGTGHTLLNLFDKSPKDCTVSLDEMRNSPFIRTLLGPDLDLDHDHVNDALSFCVGVTTVPAVWSE